MASGQTVAKFSAMGGEPALSNSAAMKRRNGHYYQQFDGATNQSIIFGDTLSRNYAGGGLTVYLHIALSSETTGDTDWDVAFERVGSGSQDVDADGFATAQSTDNTTVPGTSGHVQVIAVTFTDGAQIDSIAVGEYYRMKVTRAAVSDTSSGFAELYRVEIKET